MLQGVREGATRVSVVIATYGDTAWKDLALERAYPSVPQDENTEVILYHDLFAPIGPVRNEAAALAKYEWLLFLDADDELAPGYLQAMRTALWTTRASGQFLLTPRVSYVRKGKPQPPKFLYSGNDLSVDNYLVIGTLITKDLFEDVGGFPDYPHGFEDWGIWAKAWKAGAKIVEVPDAVYLAHVNPKSKHRVAWRDREWQVRMHNAVRQELFPELM